MSAPAGLPDPPPNGPEEDVIGRAAVAFEAAWRESRSRRLCGADPRAFDRADAVEPVRSGLAFALASIDLEHRLRLGEPARVEEYLSRFPGAVFDRAMIAELIVTEYLGRLFQGDDANRESYRGRFPNEADDALLNRLGEERAAPANDPAAPRHRIIAPHGAGGLGMVHLAFDRVLKRPVAVKELTGARDSAEPARARREAEIAARLDHPGIITILGYETWPDGRPYYVMKFVVGPTLLEAIGELHALRRVDPTGFAAALKSLLVRFAFVCHAMAHAHERGIVHLDLKPANLVLGPHEQSIVIDWGSARRLSGDDEGAVSSGTPAYMSPEQAQGERSVWNASTDVFNLGATLYHLLTGSAPFARIAAPPEGAGAGAVKTTVTMDANRVRGRGVGGIGRPRALVKSLPRALEAICLKAMAEAPADRYASARELADDLDRLFADMPISAYREPAIAAMLRWTRRHKPAVRAGLVATAALAVGLGAFVRWEQVRRSGIRSQAIAAWTAGDRAMAASGAVRDVATADPVELKAAAGHYQMASELLQSIGGKELDRVTAQRGLAIELAYDRTIVARIDDARLAGAVIKEGGYDDHAMQEGFLEAFELMYVDPLNSEVDQCARLIGASRVKAHLQGAVLDWAISRPAPARKGEPAAAPVERLLTIAWKSGMDAESVELARRIVAKDKPGLLAAIDRMDEAKPDRDRLRLIMRASSLVDLSSALPKLERMQRAHPGDFWINHNLARAYMYAPKPRLDKSIAYFRAAIAAAPDCAGARHNLGEALFASEDIEGAVAELETASRLAPRNSQCHYDLGVALFVSKKLERATEEFQIAKDLAPNDPDAALNLGTTLRIRGKPADAIAPLQRAIELAPKNEQPRRNLVSVYVMLDRIASARAELVAAIDAIPELGGKLGLNNPAQRSPDALERAARKIKDDYEREEKAFFEAH